MQGSSSAEPGPSSNDRNQDVGHKLWWETLYPDFDTVGLKDKYDFNWYDVGQKTDDVGSFNENSDFDPEEVSKQLRRIVGSSALFSDPDDTITQAKIQVAGQ
jgi:hypothetical protein